MKEIYTKALVLDRFDKGEADGRVILFSQDFGKISAKAKSLRKITSKSSGHLQPLSFVRIRMNSLVGKGGDFLILDCMQDDEMADFNTTKRLDIIPFIKFLDNFTYELHSDKKLWEYLVDIFKEKRSPKDMLKMFFGILGFDESSIVCAFCGKKEISGWVKKDKSFVCRSCSLKVGRDRVEYM